MRGSSRVAALGAVLAAVTANLNGTGTATSQLVTSTTARYRRSGAGSEQERNRKHARKIHNGRRGRGNKKPRR